MNNPTISFFVALTLALIAVVSCLDTPSNGLSGNSISPKNLDSNLSGGAPSQASVAPSEVIAGSGDSTTTNNPKPEPSSDYDDDEIVLSRLDLAKLSENRARLTRSYHDAKELTDAKCSTYPELLYEMLGDRASPDRKILLEQVVGVLSRRKLPFNNPQPVLIDLQECLKSLPVEEKPSGPKREVIAGPPRPKRLDETSPSEKGIEKALNEYSEVKNNVKDFGQDIYLLDKNQPQKRTNDGANKNEETEDLDGTHDGSGNKQPDQEGEVIRERIQHPDDYQVSDHLDEVVQEENPEQPPDRSDGHPGSDTVSNSIPDGDNHQDGGAYAYAHSSATVDSDGNSEVTYHTSTTDSQGNTKKSSRKYRKELEDYPVYDSTGSHPDDGSDVNRDSLEAELDESYREIFDLRNRVAELELIADRATTEATQAKEALQISSRAQANPSVERARAETYRHQYEAVAEREEHLLRLLNEYRAKLAEQERHATDNYETSDTDVDDDFEVSSGATDPIELASKLAHKFDFSEDPVKRCARYYLLFSYPKKVDKQVIKTVARLRVPSYETGNADYQNTLRAVSTGLLQSSKKKANLVGKDIQQCLAQDNSNTKPGVNYNYHYTSVGQTTPKYVVPLPPIPPLPPFPAIPAPRLYRNYN